MCVGDPEASLQRGSVVLYHTNFVQNHLVWLMECMKNVKGLWSFAQMDKNTTLLKCSVWGSYDRLIIKGDHVHKM